MEPAEWFCLITEYSHGVGVGVGWGEGLEAVVTEGGSGHWTSKGRPLGVNLKLKEGIQLYPL